MSVLLRAPLPAARAAPACGSLRRPRGGASLAPRCAPCAGARRRGAVVGAAAAGATPRDAADVVVVGAGVAGLHCARKLHQVHAPCEWLAALVARCAARG